MIDNKTPRLALPLPNVDNYLEDDVVRLGDALTILDTKVATIGDDGLVSQDQLPDSIVQVGVDGKIPVSQLPAVAITDTFPVSSEAAMLALDAQPGDVAIRDDETKSYILMASPASSLANWKEIVNDALVQLGKTTGASLVRTTDNKTVQEKLQEKANIGSEQASTLTRLAQQDGATLINQGENTLDVLLKANRTALSSFTEHGGQVAAMREDLENPLTQYLGIVFCGDSITWGMGASGIATTEPRSHVLTDARNTTASNTFVNLVAKYIRDVFHYSPTVTETNWTGSPSGKCITTYSEELRLFPGYAPFVVTGTWSSAPTGVTRPESSMNRILDTGTVGDYLTFEFTGYSFDIMFAALLSGASGFCAVYSNDVLVTEFSTAATDNGLSDNTWGVRKTITLPSFVRKATIKLVYSKVATGASNSILRLEAIIVNKTTRITNQGIIGTNSYEWMSLLSSAISTGDKYCFMQIGVNDRGGVSSQAYAPNALTGNVKSLVATLRSASVNPIICCSNQVSGSQLTATMKFNTNSVAYALAKVARDQACDFINNMPPTSLLRNFLNYSDDGLHPNDIGHYAMYLNIINALHNSDGLKATRTTVTTGSFAVINGNTDVVMQAPFVANNSSISSIEVSVNGGKYGIPGTVGILSPDSNQYVSVGRIFVDTSAVNTLLKVTSNVAKTITLSIRVTERIFPF